MRPDKLTYSFLESLLKLYLYPDRLKEEVPLLKWLSRPLKEIEEIAQIVINKFNEDVTYPWRASIEEIFQKLAAVLCPAPEFLLLS
jgi:seryl-tRNA(Sec) selenium transferase